MATLSPFNQSTNSEQLPYQRCLIPNISEDVQHTLRDVTNIVVLPLDMLLALLSITCNSIVLTAIVRTRSLQHPSLLLLGSLSITDVLWAIFSIVKNMVTFTLYHFCPKGLAGIGLGFAILCMFSTLGNLAIISRDRFLAVSKPWWYRNHVTRLSVIKQTSVVWVLSLTMSVIVYVGSYVPFVGFIERVIGGLFYVVSIIAIIFCYSGIFVANIRHRNTMNQHGGQVLATLRREKKLANTVGLILIVLCFTTLPALIAPLVLVLIGFSPGDGLVPLRPFYHLFVTLNGLLNPLLNYGRNGNVRRAVRVLLCCRLRCGGVHPRHTSDCRANQNNRDPANTPNRVTVDIPLKPRPVLSTLHN